MSFVQASFHQITKTSRKKIISSQNLTNSKKRQPLKNSQKTGSHPEVFSKKVFLEILQNSQENTCARVSFLIKLQPERPAILFKKRLQHSVSCGFCEISKNNFSYKTLPVAASEKSTFNDDFKTFTNGDFHRISQSQLKNSTIL